MIRIVMLLVAVGVMQSLPERSFANAVGDATVPFSARIIMSGEVLLKGTVRYTPASSDCPKSYRYDLAISHLITGDEIAKVIWVYRNEPEISWIAWPGKGKYRTINYNQRQKILTFVDDEIFETSLVGSEVIAEFTTNRFSFSGAVDRGDAYSGHIWLTEDNIPVRMVGTSKGRDFTHKFELEMGEIHIGVLSCSIFDIPNG